MKRFEDVYPDHPKGGFLYLASVYRKHKDGLINAYLEAQEAQAALWKAGVNAFSPIACFHPTAIMHQIHLTDHDWWMRHDRPYMLAARGLIILKQKNWMKSGGISEERAFFKKRNSPIFSLDWPLGKLDVR